MTIDFECFATDAEIEAALGDYFTVARSSATDEAIKSGRATLIYS